MDVYQEQVTPDILLLRAAGGDLAARGHLFEIYWPKLIAMVSLRLDRRLSSQLDPADIVQQAMIIATRRMDAYLQNPELPFYPWLYRLTLDCLARAHTKLGRIAGNEIAVSNFAGTLSAGSVVRLAAMVVDSGTSPSGKLARKDSEESVRDAIGRLTPKVREVLVMHYVESLTFREIAAILGINESAAKMRHVRGLEEIQQFLDPSREGVNR